MADIIKYPTGKAYVDLNGQYTTMSSSGNQYILVVYDYDLNAIIEEPLKMRHKVDIVNGYRNLHKQLIINGYKPNIETLDNEASDILLKYTKKIKLMYSWCHCIYIAEIYLNVIFTLSKNISNPCKHLVISSFPSIYGVESLHKPKSI